jgi:hypothetical protein
MLSASRRIEAVANAVLALKLLLVPLFLGLVSLAGKRWGPGVAGWLAGFPIVTGPILLLLAMEKGTGFAAQAATASLSAVFASVAFSVAYCRVCRRKPWPHSLLAGLCAWLLVACVLNRVPLSPWLALAIALGTLLAAPRCFPAVAAPALSNALPRQELFLRMLAGALLTLAVTSLSALIGASWSGLLAVFPLLGIVLAVFSQRACGPAFVVAMLKAMVSGLYSFVTFCFLLTLSLPGRGITASFVMAIIAAIIVQSTMKLLLARRQAPGAAPSA